MQSICWNLDNRGSVTNEAKRGRMRRRLEDLDTEVRLGSPPLVLATAAREVEIHSHSMNTRDCYGVQQQM